MVDGEWEDCRATGCSKVGMQCSRWPRVWSRRPGGDNPNCWSRPPSLYVLSAVNPATTLARASNSRSSHSHLYCTNLRQHHGQSFSTPGTLLRASSGSTSAVVTHRKADHGLCPKHSLSQSDAAAYDYLFVSQCTVIFALLSHMSH